MNKRRRFKSKRRRAEGKQLRRVPLLRFHREAFALVWRMPQRIDMLYGVGYFRVPLRPGVD